MVRDDAVPDAKTLRSKLYHIYRDPTVSEDLNRKAEAHEALPKLVQDAYTLLNARLGFGRQDQRWMLEVWGQNLTDETYKQVGIDAPIQSGSWNAFLGAPRTYGVTVRFNYF